MTGIEMELRLIGDLAVRKQGSPVRLPPSKKARALLAYLVLNPGSHRRERLCELFWQIPDDPRGSLRWALSKLRAVVNQDGVERIQATRDHVAFNAEAIDIDYVDAQATASNGFDAVSLDQLSELADRLSRDILEGLDLSGQAEYETWRLAEQEKARELSRKVLSALIARLEDAPAARADRLYVLASLDPYNVDVHAQLIKALMKSGRAAEAERQLQVSNETLLNIENADLSRLQTAYEHAPVAAAPPTTPFNQEIRYCKSSNGAQIAYATVGEGAPIIKTANWLNHLEFDWESPVWSHFFRALSTSNTLARYDARGNGLSDWRIKDFSIERNVEDLHAVIEALGYERVTLLGFSQGCAVSIKYAALHPERIEKLILYGGYARGWNVETPLEMRNSTKAMITLMRTGWGQDNPVFRQMFAALFMPDAPPENHEWFNELQRMTTSPENAAKCLEALGEVDVREYLGKIQAPTLVIHSRGDNRIPLEAGRELATGIPDARFVVLETNNHLIPDCDPAWPRFRDAILDFEKA
ncbi:MAG: alpha/beta fold hydrolase [Pseudomonadota bacterium]